MEVIGNTIGWKNTGIYSKNFAGEEQFFHYDLDPIVLFERSELDENTTPHFPSKTNPHY